MADTQQMVQDRIVREVEEALGLAGSQTGNEQMHTHQRTENANVLPITAQALMRIHHNWDHKNCVAEKTAHPGKATLASPPGNSSSPLNASSGHYNCAQPVAVRQIKAMDQDKPAGGVQSVHNLKLTISYASPAVLITKSAAVQNFQGRDTSRSQPVLRRTTEGLHHLMHQNGPPTGPPQLLLQSDCAQPGAQHQTPVPSSRRKQILPKPSTAVGDEPQSHQHRRENPAAPTANCRGGGQKKTLLPSKVLSAGDMNSVSQRASLPFPQDVRTSTRQENEGTRVRGSERPLSTESMHNWARRGSMPMHREIRPRPQQQVSGLEIQPNQACTNGTLHNDSRALNSDAVMEGDTATRNIICDGYSTLLDKETLKDTMETSFEGMQTDGRVTELVMKSVSLFIREQLREKLVELKRCKDHRTEQNLAGFCKISIGNCLYDELERERGAEERRLVLAAQKRVSARLEARKRIENAAGISRNEPADDGGSIIEKNRPPTQGLEQSGKRIEVSKEANEAGEKGKKKKKKGDTPEPGAMERAQVALRQLEGLKGRDASQRRRTEKARLKVCRASEIQTVSALDRIVKRHRRNTRRRKLPVLLPSLKETVIDLTESGRGQGAALPPIEAPPRLLEIGNRNTSPNITLRDCISVLETDPRTRKGILLFKWLSRLGESDD